MADVADIASEMKDQIPHALQALQQYDGQKREKMPLFPDMKKNVLLIVKYKKPFFKNTGQQNIYVTQPYPDRNYSNTSICLILPDFDRSEKATKDHDVDKQARQWTEILRDKYDLIPGGNYAKIFTFNQLKREYTDVKERVRLANLYDIFFVDAKLSLKVDYFMGSIFKKPTHRPVLINSEENFSDKIKEAYNQTLILFKPMCDVVSIRIGNLNQKLKHLKSNAFTILDSLLKNFPGGSINIRSCYLQAIDVSLPVYVDFGSPNEINFDLPAEPELIEIVGECSTLPDGLEVKVCADGNVTTIDKKTGEEVLYPTEQDEWECDDDIKPLNIELIQKILKKGKIKTKLEEIKNELKLKKKIINKTKKLVEEEVDDNDDNNNAKEEENDNNNNKSIKKIKKSIKRKIIENNNINTMMMIKQIKKPKKIKII